MLEHADHVLEGLGQAAEAHDHALEAVDLVEVPVVRAFKNRVLEFSGGVFDFFGLEQ